jgi:putative toxin-antitoxin system antitoxin component (TIGR02293 family)
MCVVWQYDHAKMALRRTHIMISVKTLTQTLGGLAVLKRPVATPQALHELVGSGLPFAALENVMHRFQLARAEAEAVLQIPARTMARRKQGKRLRSNESDRLIRLARLAAEASEVLGSDEKAAAWLHRSNRALGGQAPIVLIGTDVGAKHVEELLGRIAHGVVS